MNPTTAISLLAATATLYERMTGDSIPERIEDLWNQAEVLPPIRKFRENARGVEKKIRRAAEILPPEFVVGAIAELNIEMANVSLEERRRLQKAAEVTGDIRAERYKAAGIHI